MFQVTISLKFNVTAIFLIDVLKDFTYESQAFIHTKFVFYCYG